jgi:streptogramin lyase
VRRLLLVLLLVTACSSGSPTGPVAVPTPTLPAGVRAVHVGGAPCGVAEAAGAAWVSDATTAHLFRIEPSTMTATVRATLDATPCELTYAFGALWVSTQSGYLDRVDVATGAVKRVRVGEKSYEVEPAAGALWVSDRDSAQLTRVDPRTLATSRLPLPGTHPGGLVYAFGHLWVGDDTSGASRVLRVDPVRRTVTRVGAGSRPAYLAATSTAVWVSDVESGSVSRLDPRTLQATTTQVGSSPVNLDVLHDQVWVPDDNGNAIYRLDDKGTVVQTVAAGEGGPAVVAPVGDALFVTLFNTGDVWSIGG